MRGRILKHTLELTILLTAILITACSGGGGGGGDAAPVGSPVVTNPGGQTAILGSAVTLPILATDPEGDTLTYSATDLPPGLSIDPVTGEITGTTTTAGVFNSVITVDDGNSAPVDIPITWAVTNTPPTLTNPGAQTNLVNDTVSLQIVGSDVDAGDTPTFSAESLPTGLSISTSGLITGSPSEVGAFDTEVTIDDGNGSTVTEVFTWTINAAVTVFVTDGTNLQSFSAGSPATLSAATTITSVDTIGNILGMDFRPSDGTLFILTDADQDGVEGAGTLFTVDTSSGLATLAANLIDDGSILFTGLPTDSIAFGVDFDPSNDALRIVDLGASPTDNTVNLSVNVADGTVTSDTVLPALTRISALAYDSELVPTLFAIDGNTDALNTIIPAAAGTVQVIGALGGNVTASITTFDISNTGLALAGLTPPGGSTITTLNSVNLATGAATPIGVIGDGTVPFVGLSIQP